jgi:hypothetical protein
MTAKALCTLLAPLLLCGQSWAQFPTPSERTGYRATPTYEETIDYLRELQAQSDFIHLDRFGETPLGRPLYSVVVSKDRAFDPASARRTGKLVLLIQNGIHAGEIDGKDACLELIRDLAVTGERADLLEHVVLVIVPVFNVDGHEQRSPYNRINQNGPEEMGFRATSQNYNLNRDYMKLDAPETRALLALWNLWNPDFFIDNHVTDGADFQYALTYTISRHPNTAPEIAAWNRDWFIPVVTRKMASAGEPIFPYVVTRGGPLRSGIIDFVETPRYSTGYAATRNRPGLLVETHMLKSYARRVRATYLMMVAVLELLNEGPDLLAKAVREADSHAVSGLERTLSLSFKRDSIPDTVDFLGFEYDTLKSEISGGTWTRYDTTRPVILRLPYFDRQHSTFDVTVPWAYVIPPQWTDVIARLKWHGVETLELARAQAVPVERYRLHNVKWEAESFEGHHLATCSTTTETALVDYPAGSVVVLTSQVRSRLVVNALEPLAPDAFLRWGFFDTILEQKEYAEDYAAEKLAASMLSSRPDIRREYDSLLAADSAFAGNPADRWDFFYKRSPWAEPMFDVYPVGRILTETALVTRPH